MIKSHFVFATILLFAIIFSNKTFSQTTFQKKYNFSDGSLVNIIQDNDSSFWTVGCYSANQNDIILLHNSSNGNLISSKIIRNPSANSTDVAYSICKVNQNGFAICGETQYSGIPKFLILRIDSIGDTLWTRIYSGRFGANKIISTNNGGFVLCGYSFFNVNNKGIYFLKIDSLGNIDTTRTYGGQSFGSFDKTSDGGFIVAGTVNLPVDSTNIILIKIDSIGNPQWSKTYGGSNIDIATSVKQTNDGGFVIAGFTKSFGAGRDDGFLIRTNSLGDTLWNRTFGDTSLNKIESVIETSDNGYFLNGYSTQISIPGKFTTLIKMNSSGVINWIKNYGANSNYEGPYTYDAKQTLDGGYVLCGDYQTQSGSGYQPYILKVDSGGNYDCDNVNLPITITHPITHVSNYSTTVSSGGAKSNVQLIIQNSSPFVQDICSNNQVSEPFSYHSEFSIFPNPVSSLLSINGLKENSSVQLFDIAGKILFSSKTNPKTIDMSAFPNGIYILKTKEGVKKIVKLN